MRRFGLFAALLLLAGVLAACTITVTYSPPPNPRAATANTNNTTPVASNVTVPGNSTIYYDVTLPSSVRSYPLLYVELMSNSNLNLSLISYSTYHTLASSHSASYFASGTVGLASLSTAGGVAGQSVGVNYNCQGPCVIWPMNGETHVYVGIENTGSAFRHRRPLRLRLRLPGSVRDGERYAVGGGPAVRRLARLRGHRDARRH